MCWELFKINFCPQRGIKSPEQVKVSGLTSSYRLAWHSMQGAFTQSCSVPSVLFGRNEKDTAGFSLGKFGCNTFGSNRFAHASESEYDFPG